MNHLSVELVWTKIQMGMTILGGWLGYFVGGVDGLMTALLVLMVMDYVTGVMCAVIDRELSSSMGFRGIFKKVLILMLVGVAHIVDLHVVRSGEALRSAVICFSPLATSVLSISAEKCTVDTKSSLFSASVSGENKPFTDTSAALS